MFHFNTTTPLASNTWDRGLYNSYPSLATYSDPREKYEHALRQAKAAEAEYLAAQAAQAEEAALLRRLEEIRLEKLRHQHLGAPAPHLSDYPVDRLSLLRLQLEEEERKRAQALAAVSREQQLERELAHYKQLEQARKMREEEDRRQEKEQRLAALQQEQALASRVRQQQQERSSRDDAPVAVRFVFPPSEEQVVCPFTYPSLL